MKVFCFFEAKNGFWGTNHLQIHVLFFMKVFCFFLSDLFAALSRRFAFSMKCPDPK